MTLNEEIILSCAFRYALGRRTYVVRAVCEELIRNEKDLGWDFKERVAREIQEYQVKCVLAGQDFDDDEWNYIKWLFTERRRVIVEAKRYKTGVWERHEAVWGADGVYYSLHGKDKYFHTVRIPPIKKG